jgi:hypothetical protein
MEKAITAFREVITNPLANHQHKWKGYGFIPDINKISFGEWLDLDTNCKDFPKNLPKLLSILYRPISSEIGTKYKIEQYTADHLSNAKDFEQMPLSIANGALLFFSTIESELVTTSLSFLESQIQTNLTKFHVIEELADRDVTKFDAITETQASTIFAHLSYRLDYYNYQKQLMSKKD